MILKKTLKFNNGATLISHRIDNLNTVSLSLSFKAGTLFENENNSGITHLIEHLFFRRLDDLPQCELYRLTHKYGFEITGKTSYDYVTFKIKTVKKYFYESAEILLKILNDFSWCEREIDLEKKVVLKQIENSSTTFDDWINETYFCETKYEFPIMGDCESVLALPVAEINEWKKKFFNSDNACLIITGGYSEDDLSKVSALLSRKILYGTEQNIPVCLPRNFCKRDKNNRYTLEFVDCEISNVVIFYDINEKMDFEMVRLLVSILGEGYGNKLSLILREKYGVTDEIYTQFMCFKGFNRISFSYAVKNCDLKRSLCLFFEVIRDFCDEIEETDFLSSIIFFTDNQIMDFDDCETLNDNYVISDFVLGGIVSEPLQRKQKYESLTIDSLNKAANKVFEKSNLSLLIEGNKEAQKIADYIEKYIISQ